MDNPSLAHTKWDCTYHIVFIPKYRRKVMYGELRTDIREIIKKLCEYKEVAIVEGSVGGLIVFENNGTDRSARLCAVDRSVYLYDVGRTHPYCSPATEYSPPTGERMVHGQSDSQTGDSDAGTYCDDLV